MFEYIDEKLGKVKVVNVTEARASMASIMNDKDVSYIITKNNKPIRVIVHYDILKKSGTLLGRSASASKFTEAKDPVKGLLESRVKDLEKIEEVKTATKVEEMPPVVQKESPPVKTEEPIVKEVAQEEMPHAETIIPNTPPPND